MIQIYKTYYVNKFYFTFVFNIRKYIKYTKPFKKWITEIERAIKRSYEGTHAYTLGCFDLLQRWS